MLHLYSLMNQISLLMSSPATGDTNKPWLWVGIGAGALLLGVLFVLFFNKRKDNDDDE